MRALGIYLVLHLCVAAAADEPIRLAETPALSPDGKTIVFSWRDDLWRVSSRGGKATRLTVHPARDSAPRFSPDGKRIAFTSDRSGANQVYVVALDDGAPRQVTFHSEGSTVQDWAPDGKSLLVSGARDHSWRRAGRFFLKRLDRSAPVMLFNGYGQSGRLSPDGRHLLFAREGTRWWRKQYRGPQASQVWLYDTAARSFSKLTAGEHEERWPLWLPGGKHALVVSQKGGTYNLWRIDLASGARVQWTHFSDDGVTFPAVSADGSTVIFRRLFDLYRLDLPGKEGGGNGAGVPQRLDIRRAGDRIHETVRRDTLSTCTQAAFTEDGREIALIAGGDLWVMDTELKEPVQVTDTPEEERDPVFSPDHGSILFVSDRDGQSDIWRAMRGDEERYWWQNRGFKLERLTNDPQPEHGPRFVPGGRVAFTNLRGDLWTMEPGGKELRLVFSSWNQPSYAFSPDGAWVAYAIDDNDFNRDIWIRRADGTGDAVNVSRHPDWESGPAWSPDGKMLAFRGRRSREESDIYYVWLRQGDFDDTKRDRTIVKALEKMKGRKKKPPETPEQKPEGAEKGKKKEEAAVGKGGRAKGPQPKKPVEVRIDFSGIEDRIRRISIPDASESDLMWSPDSKKLAFQARIDGKEGIFTVEVPDNPKPKLLFASRGGGARWLEEGNQVVWVLQGRPASLTAAGKSTRHDFRVQHAIDLKARHRAAFDQAWRTMRDRFYDGRLNNRDWNAVRKKYIGMAAETVTARGLSQVVSMMLGELNGSHLGFWSRERSWTKAGWREATVHFGARFDPGWPGPGLKVRDVIKGTPAAREKSLLRPGEIVLSVDGNALDPSLDLALALTGLVDRDYLLGVKGLDGKERQVAIRPTSYGAVRARLYEHRVEANRARVDELSEGRFGYLHIRGMSWSSFERFEAELYKVGRGKEALVIDVRDNGGGFTTDHLLTCLCQPVHAVTVPRGGGPGYPQDRIVYARWSKPIVVLCNQNSFSNAEIFSHAIKSLKRGRLVGVQTAGGVISTGGSRIMGFAFLRLPFRGWFVAADGRDMEMNGCVPDVTVWPAPEEIPNGIDRQLRRAVELLTEDVAAWKARSRPPLRKRSER